MIHAIHIFNILALFQGLFQITLLLLYRKNRIANRTLACLILCLVLGMVWWYLYLNEYNVASYYLILIIMANYPLYGPLIYFYTLSITGHLKNFSARQLRHLIPFGAYLIFLVVLHFVAGTGDITTIARPLLVFLFVFNILIFGSVLVYIGACFMLVRDHGLAIRDLFSDIEKIRLLWLYLFLLTGLVSCLLLIVSWVVFINGMLKSMVGDVTTVVFYILYFLATFGATFFSIRHPELFTMEELNRSRRSYETLNVDAVQLEEYRRRILICMEKDRPYLNDALTLKDFSDLLKMPPHIVSMTLNTCLNQNFYNFINRYRIEEVMRLIADPGYADHSLLHIAFAAGFNSKSSFNAMFKKFTGKTPSQYRAT
jgi:AraC-like DNA-binding protein